MKNSTSSSHIINNNLKETDIEVFVKIDQGAEKGALIDKGKRTSKLKKKSSLSYSPKDSNDSVNHEFSVLYRIPSLPIDRFEGIKISLAGEALIADLNNQDISPIPHHFSIYKRADGKIEIEIHFMEEMPLTDIHPDIHHP